MLLLFDIDGTLLESGEAGTRALNRAFEELFSVRDAFKQIKMAGKTDLQIIKEALKLHGINSSDGALSALLQRYVIILRREINNPRKRLKPGVKDFLELISSMNLLKGLLTGNLREGAEIKLGAFKLNRYFIDGAFGSDHEDRNQLLPIAIERFRDRGYPVLPEHCFVIGDTPRDVECAKIHGARCIAVCTGPYSFKELAQTDADLVVESLREVEKILSFLKTILHN